MDRSTFASCVVFAACWFVGTGCRSSPDVAEGAADVASAVEEVDAVFTPADDGLLSDRSRELEANAPASWREGDGTDFRIVSYSIGQSGECYVVALNGEAGGLKANLDRWCEQMNQDSLAPEEMATIPRLSVLGVSAPKLRVVGSFTGMRGGVLEDAMMFGVVVPLPEETVFIKMVGPRAELEGREREFDAFCASLR